MDAMTYIGQKYQSCAHMAIDIVEKEYNKTLPITAKDIKFEDRLKLLQMLPIKQVNEDELQEGDIVVMSSKAINGHIGIIVKSNGYLHCLHHLNTAMVCCHRLPVLKQLAIRVEGYYRLL